MSQPEAEESSCRQTMRTRVMPAVLVVGVLALAITALAMGPARAVNHLAGLVHSDNMAQSAVICFLVLTGCSAVCLYGISIVLMLNGFWFGLWGGAAINMSGIALGSVIYFVAARACFQDSLRGWIPASSQTTALIRIIEDEGPEGLKMLILLRLTSLPLLIKTGVPAALRIGTANFAIAATLGATLNEFAFAFIGSRARSIGALLNGQGTPEQWKEELGAVAVGFFILCMFGTLIARAYSNKLAEVTDAAADEADLSGEISPLVKPKSSV